jgi:hypothetical protein
MTLKRYKLELEDAINKYGYWSNQVLELNNKAMFALRFSSYCKAHDEVYAKFKQL